MLNKIVDILKIIIGAAGWVWFMIPVVFSNIFNVGNLAGLLFFGVLFLWGISGRFLRKKAECKKWAKSVISVLMAGYIAFSALFIVESGFMIEASLRKPPRDTTVIVLGCAVYGDRPSQMLRLRIEAAEEFLKENPEAKAVLSGGQGTGENISEAFCMYRELTHRGIEADRLFMEDRSTNTRENIAFSSEIIKENGLCENITVVTNNFHLYRATLSVEDYGYVCYCIPAFTPLPLLATYVMREYMGILAQWTVG